MKVLKLPVSRARVSSWKVVGRRSFPKMIDIFLITLVFGLFKWSLMSLLLIADANTIVVKFNLIKLIK
jgi:hypothetical protein